MSESNRPLAVKLTEGLGAGARLWLALVDFSILALALVCVYVTLRTLAPPEIERWQAAALGGTAMMLVRTWWNSCEAPNVRGNRPDTAEKE